MVKKNEKIDWNAFRGGAADSIHREKVINKVEKNGAKWEEVDKIYLI